MSSTKLIAGFVLAWVTGSACAQLTWNGRIVIDPATNLEWRADHASFMTSWEQDIAPVDGWRLATQDEFLTFWADAGLTADERVYYSWPDPKAQLFLQLIWEWASPITMAGDVYASLWMFNPDAPVGYMDRVSLYAANAFDVWTGTTRFYYGAGVSDVPERLRKTSEDSLVRVRPLSPVPEPAVFTILSMGLAALTARLRSERPRAALPGRTQHAA